MKTMKTSDCKKEVCEVCGRSSSVSIGKRISSPPCPFMMQMVPFPRLATQESQTSKYCPREICDYSLFISFMPSMYSKHHSYGTHNQNECHDAYKHQRSMNFT